MAKNRFKQSSAAKNTADYNHLSKRLVKFKGLVICFHLEWSGSMGLAVFYKSEPIYNKGRFKVMATYLKQ